MARPATANPAIAPSISFAARVGPAAPAVEVLDAAVDDFDESPPVAAPVAALLGKLPAAELSATELPAAEFPAAELPTEAGVVIEDGGVGVGDP